MLSITRSLLAFLLVLGVGSIPACSSPTGLLGDDDDSTDGIGGSDDDDATGDDDDATGDDDDATVDVPFDTEDVLGWDGDAVDDIVDDMLDDVLDGLGVDEDTFEDASDDCEDAFEDIEDWFEDEVEELILEAQGALVEIDNGLDGKAQAEAEAEVLEELYLALLALEELLEAELAKLAKECA